MALVAARALACIAVDQDHVLAKHLAAVDPRFARLDPALDLGLTPLAGSTRVIKNAGSLPSICVERATEPLTAEQLQPVLEAALDGSPVKILEFSRYRVPRGVIEFTRAGLTPSGLWRGRVTYGQSHSLAVWARIGAGVAAADSPAAKRRDVERGEQVTVEVTSGAARLAFPATAQSGGSKGDSVLVRNPETGRLLQAKVIANGKVLIHK